MADTKISALPAATTPLAGTEVVPLVQSSTTKNVSVANLTAGRAVSALSFNATSFSRVTAEGGSIGSTGQSLQVVRTTNDSVLYAGYRTTPDAWVIGASYASTGAYKPIILATSDLATLQAETNGDVNVKRGNLVIGTSGKGIDFSATSQAGGMTSELLNDYEEGTWVPALSSAGGNFTTIAYGDQQGWYTKIGRMVKVRGNLFTSGAITAGSASGQVYITGLPYTAGKSDLGQIWFNPDTINYNMPLALATGTFVSGTNLQLFKNGTVNNPTFNVTDLYIVGGPSNNMFFEATYMV